ncbi:MAG: glycosyl hydrolase family 79 C-terminal domain-containing protein [Solirubrobacteraceae bacterium]
MSGARAFALVAWIAAGALVAGCGGGSGGAAAHGTASAAAHRSGAQDGHDATGSGGAAVSAAAGQALPGGRSVSVAVSARPVGRPIRSGFLGFSFEFQAVRKYTGSDPSAVNPVLVALIRNLTPGQAPVLRIGGDSTDDSYVPAAGARPPAYLSYRLTPGWLATTAALARELGARMIMGVNLGANDPRLAAAEARAYVRAFGAKSIEALEIGNEPNIYSKITAYRTVLGLPVPTRPRSFGYPQFDRQFHAIAARLPPLTLAGPAMAVGPTTSPGSWLGSMRGFLAGLPRLAILTVHRYPLRNCSVPPSSPQYPSIPHLLAPYATVALAHSLKRWIQVAHTMHRRLRVDEINSVACRGKAGVSDTFASALWATDALFSLARAGVDGVDLHTLPHAAYELFRFSHTGGRWHARVAPVYYGLQLFAQAAPAGSRLLSVTRTGADSGLSAWATRAPDGTVRVVLINEDRAHGANVSLTPPGGSGSAATVERMTAPSVASRGGVALGGRSYGASTYTGRLAAPVTSTVAPAAGTLTIAVPRGSAALVTLPAG